MIPEDRLSERIPRPRSGALLAACLSAALFPCAVLASQDLPDIRSLPELKLELVLDLSDHSEVGLPWVGTISPRNEFVFYDVQLRRVMILPLDGRGGRAVGAFGEGPGEYQNVRDIRTDRDGCVVLDSRGRLLEYDWEGRCRREMKLPRFFEKILGRSGEDFYLVGRDLSPNSSFDRVVMKWREGREATPLFAMSADAQRTRANTLDGKPLSGGTFTLSEPALAFLEDGFAASAGADYRIRFFNFTGKERMSWSVKAPHPEFFGKMFGSFNGKRPAFAIREIFVPSPLLAVVGNFYHDGKPRLDVFSREGKRTSSWLIPLTCEAPVSRCQIEGEYLIHFSSEEGTRIFRIVSRL